MARGNDEYCALFASQSVKSIVIATARYLRVGQESSRRFCCLAGARGFTEVLTADRLDLRERGGLLWFVTMLRVALTAVPVLIASRPR